MPTKVTVHSSPSTLVSINQNKVDTVKTIGIMGTGVNRIANMIDVDMLGSSTNDTLVYNSNTGIFVVQTLPVIDGGTF